MSSVKVNFKITDRDNGLAKLLELGKRVERDKPYAKAGILASKHERHAVLTQYKTTVTPTKFGGVTTSTRKVKVKVAPGTKGSTEVLDNVTLAVIHEFGAPSVGIPSRPFMRSAFDRNEGKYEQQLRLLVRGIYEGKTSERQALGLMGLAMATDIKLGITSGTGIAPADSPATIRRKLAKGNGKGAPRTLVDTGQLLGSVSWAVVAGEHEADAGADE